MNANKPKPGGSKETKMQQQPSQAKGKNFLRNESQSVTSKTSTNSATGGQSKRQQQKPNQQKKRRQARKIEKKIIEDSLQAAVNANLLKCTEGDELKTLTRILQPANDLLFDIYQRVFQDLSHILSRKCPYFNIHPFGSTISGLAFKDSDFDLYIEIPNNVEPVANVIRILIGVMRQCQTFHQIVPILHARVPIIKCIHSQTGYSCDISFSSSLGVENSQIVRFLVQFDYRVHPLTIILKYWMRTHGISGSGKITNYCLFWMIVYYLQKIPKPILPPIAALQDNIPERLVGYWNMAFNSNFVFRSNNQLLVVELLIGFFEFYSNFDFEQLICPLYARAYKRQDFHRNTPPEFRRYIDYMCSEGAQELFTSKLLCIQDPFNLAYNVGGCCGKNTFTLFQNEMRNALAVCKREMATGLSSAIFLYKLFNDFAKGTAASQGQVGCTIGNKSSGPFECNIKAIEYELSIVRLIMSQMNADADVVIEAIQVNQLWVEKVIDFIEQILKNFFVFELNEITDTNKVKKSPKLIGQSDVYSNRYNKKFSIIAKHDVYMSRKMRKQITADYIDVEAALSRKCQQKPYEIDMRCSVLLSTNEKFDSVKIVFADETKIDSTVGKRKYLKLIFQSFVRTIRNHLRAHFFKYQNDNILKETENKP